MGKFCTRFAAYENLIGRYRALGDKGELIMASNMVGKTVKFAIGTKESLNKCGKILQ
jgi:hypothetical protein